ncbi:MAG: GNAT family protein [Candidatus Korobacteraceae bacterium]
MLLELSDLKVRSWRKDDLQALLRHANNAKIAANLRDQFPHPYTRRDGIDFLDFARSQEPECAFAIEFGDEAVGGVGFLVGRDIARMSAEMGYWLSEDFWGRGIATRAVTAMSEWAFDHYKLTRVFAMAFAHNAGSIRVLEKSGFVREGVMRRSAIKSGAIMDQILFAKVR